MNSFVSNLLRRHFNTEENVKPRVRGRFDTVAVFSETMTGDNDLGTEKGEQSQQQSSSLSPDWKSKPKRQNSENKKDEKVDLTTGKNYNSSSPGPLLIADPFGKKDEEEHQPVSRKISAEPVQQIRKEPGDTKPVMPTPGDGMMQRLRTRYLERTYLVKPGGERKQDDSTVSQKRQFPGLQERNDSLLVDEKNDGYTEMEGQSSVSPLIAKRKSDHRLPGSINTGTTKVINVSIGRIEVRASFPPVENRTALKKENTGLLSLDQYLEQVKSGKQ